MKRAPLLDRLAARLVVRQLGTWRAARVRMTLPDGRVLDLGAAGAPRRFEMAVRDWSFFRRAVFSGDIGVGESWMDGYWDCDDLAGLCRCFLADHTALPAEGAGSGLAQAAGRALQWLRRNTPAGSRRNVRAHYDLGNDFFRLFLDDTLTYSCAVFPNEKASLEEAQREKIDGACRRLGLRENHHLLEIGSGWGALAIHAARRYGCRVTSVTLSGEQLALARERAAEAGIADRVDFRLCDYRKIEGRFDRIVSVEMFEAVGYEYWEAFFRQCSRLLAPGGRMWLQTITVPDARFDAYRRGFDWIRKYVFPGGLLPSLAELRRVAESAGLRVAAVREIGPHYARTLRLWRERFLARLPEARRLGHDERFLRMWQFYLESCEAAFAERYVGDAQVELTPAPLPRHLRARPARARGPRRAR